MNVDQPAWRWRLWSWTDSPIAYYLTHFREARRARAEASRQWLRLYNAS